MKTAYLRIKFTPLLKKLQKSSNHCLEIVPEITYSQNLDAIEWKTEEHYIEYTVPIIYKIILRKKDVTNTEGLDRTYYSCVDLSLPSSDTDLMKQESGDIKRILSDSFILSYLTPNVENDRSIVIRNSSDDGEKDKETRLAEVQTEGYSDNSISNKISIVEPINVFEETRRIGKVQTEQTVVLSKTQVGQDDDKENCEKMTNQVPINNPPDHDQIRIQSVSQFQNCKNNIDSIQSLYWTPIYPTNASDNIAPGDKNVEEAQPVIFLGKKSPKKVVQVNEIDDPANVFLNDYYLYDILNINASIFKPIQQIERMSIYRVSPEVRVAKIVQQIEREIKPFKIMLSDIIRKCSTLGLKQNFRKEISNGENEINKCCNMSNLPKSNRVVYSIVFDG